jgi:hypothetical protein
MLNVSPKTQFLHNELFSMTLMATIGFDVVSQICCGITPIEASA